MNNTTTSRPSRARLEVSLFTIFPEQIESYMASSILGRAKGQDLLEVTTHDIRSCATDAHRSVDDAPFGGGPGMVLRPEPVFSVVRAADPPRPLYVLTPAGRRFDQRFANELKELGAFSLLCGRYEGVDERIVEDLCDGEISIGDYVLAGGELAALVVIEAVARLVPGVLLNPISAVNESFQNGLLEHPHYTRPASFEGHEVPGVLLSGDHDRVARWQLAESLHRTIERRPDMMAARGGPSDAEVRLLVEHGYPLSAGQLDRESFPSTVPHEEPEPR